MQAVIETRQLMKRFGRHQAVAGIDLRVGLGSIFGFLGPNGAGKTTTIRLLLGLLRPSAGEIEMFGLAMPAARMRIARLVGALVETPAHYDHLTGSENLDVTRRLLGLPGKEIGRVLDMVDLAHAAQRSVRGYSLGMRQRLGIARAMLGSPKLLILDEPTNGLDPDGIRDVRHLLRELPERAGATVFVSSHLLSEVEQTATHLALMWQGRLIAQGALEDVLRTGSASLELEVDDVERADALLRASGLDPVHAGAGRMGIRAGSGGPAPADINYMLTAAGLGVSHLALRRPSLEDLYLQLTRTGAGTRSHPHEVRA